MSFRFEGPEHQKIGDGILLRLPDGNISGGQFSYQVGKNVELSFGQIVSLAGDFYGNSKTTGDAEQISDQWDTNREASISRFLGNADLLRLDTAGYLEPVLAILMAQEREISNMLREGRDPAQSYKSIADKFNKLWARCTGMQYLWLSLCNWDHFGEDAVKAYKAGHVAALRQAKTAHNTRSIVDLRHAYFLEAFAAHFLTDLFSSGHLRTPRRALHYTYFPFQSEDSSGMQPDAMSGLPSDEISDMQSDDISEQLKIPWPTFWPADQCAQAMHDEDCASGLWAKSLHGHCWPTYGDKQLVSTKGNLSFDAALDAVQAGAHEIYKMYEDGKDRDISHFAALSMIPDLTSLDSANFFPLFKVSDDGKTLSFRASLDERGVPTYEDYPLPKAPFQRLLNRIKESGQHQHQLPLSLPLLSPSSLLHFRHVSDTQLAISKYGQTFSRSAVSKGAKVESWNMVSQQMVEIPNPEGRLTWLATSKIDSDIYFLVGKVDRQRATGQLAYHLGLRITDSGVEQVSFHDSEDANESWLAGDIHYGRLCAGSDTLSMVKFWYRQSTPWKPKFELWTFDQGVEEPPTRRSVAWPNPPSSAPYASFCTKLEPMDASETYVTCSVSDAKTVWTFTSFSDNYRTPNSQTFEEDIGERAQRILPLPTRHAGPHRFVRLFYGQNSGTYCTSNPTHPTPPTRAIQLTTTADTIRLDVLSLQNHQPVTDTTIHLPAAGSATPEAHYLTWFLADVNRNGHPDLVSLVRAPDGQLTVLAVPGAAPPRFFERTVSRSPIGASDKGSELTAAFMRPVAAFPARYRFPRSGEETSAAVLSLFDNYGVLGVRVVRPSAPAGSLAYEIGGQIPAVAGQLARGLGWDERSYRPGRAPVGLFVE
ncbi:phosphatidylcholine-hydrolyzing phospholipase [Diplodia corticola]|uniref:Phosphatidylcholine-hydrolyzing phospholipase n=1 Tax=Diplodia corticola TaxID=236234 RepID=A0A1J9QYM3_9PEZI|nr:phosphatidylcholine-hydrolyzing phospholipase [Diplodia corticola]OJD34158.1 phosphatidylcholine-hydrolyzing phospholipase [Diplodia corticola]